MMPNGIEPIIGPTQKIRFPAAIASLAAVALAGFGAAAQQQGALGIGIVDSQVNLKGAFVNTVNAGGAGAASGLVPGDIITAIDGKPVATGSDLVRAIGVHHAGDAVSLHVVHYGNVPASDVRVTLGVAVAAAPQSPTAPARPAAAAPAPTVQWLRYADPAEHAFTIDVPAGWRVSGGTRRMSTIDIRSGVEAISPDGTIDLFYGDTGVPIYTVPSPLLARGGLRQGMTYSPGYGQQFLIEPYLNGEAFAAQWGAQRMARDCTAVTRTGARVRPDASQAIDMAFAQGGIRTSIQAGEATFACNLRGRQAVGYVFSGTELVQSQTSTLWDVKSLAGFAAAAPEAGAAYALLGHMVASFAIDPAWAARQQQTAAQTDRIVSQTNAVVSSAIIQNGRTLAATSDIIVNGGAARSAATSNAIENYDENAVRGTSTYVNPETGTARTLDNEVSHQYQLPGGAGTLGTNSENQPGPGVQELQRVPAGQ